MHTGGIVGLALTPRMDVEPGGRVVVGLREAVIVGLAGGVAIGVVAGMAGLFRRR